MMMLGGEWFSDADNNQSGQDSIFSHINELKRFMLDKERIPYSDRVLVSVSEFLTILYKIEKAAEEMRGQ